MDSVGFDRAAEYYDRTRVISGEALERMVRVLDEELRGRGTCLEVGVGTGMISLPLAAAGIPLTGVDLSEPMLAKLAEKAGGRPPFPVTLADATALPFADESFGGVLMRHVLHLIPSWQRALEEATRVLRPGGVLLVSHGEYPGLALEIYERFVDVSGLERPWVGLPPGEVDEVDRALGVRGRDLPEIPERIEEPIARFLQGIDEGLYSWTWHLDEERRMRAAASVRSWAESELGDLDRPLAVRTSMRWRAYELPDETT